MIARSPSRIPRRRSSAANRSRVVTGQAVLERLQVLMPSARFLLSSGYTANRIACCAPFAASSTPRRRANGARRFGATLQ